MYGCVVFTMGGGPPEKTSEDFFFGVTVSAKTIRLSNPTRTIRLRCLHCEQSPPLAPPRHMGYDGPVQELPWRIRRPAHSEPRVANFKKKKKVDPLEHLCGRADRTRDNIDALEKLLANSMPPKVVLQNSFDALRLAISQEVEELMEAQWWKGVRHEQCMSEQLRRNTEPAASLPMLDDDFARFLDEVPDEEVCKDVADHGLIDLAALEREINFGINLVEYRSVDATAIAVPKD